MAEGLSQQDIQDLQEIAQKLPPGDPRQKKISLLLNSAPTQFEQDNNRPGLLSDPQGYLQGRISELGNEAQRQQNQYLGPEGEQLTANASGTLAKGASYLQRFGHGVLAVAPEAARVVDKAALGLMDPKAAAAVAAGVIDPAIPAAYFATQGTSALTGIGQDGPGQIQQLVANPSPDNAQDTLLSGATVAGSVAGGATAPRGISSAPLKSAADALSRRMYQSALKPPPGSYSLPEVRSMVDYGLQQGIPVSEAGVAKLNGLIDRLNQTISQEIAEGSQARTNIGTTQVESPAVAGGTSAEIQAGLAAQRARQQVGSMGSTLPSRITGESNPIADSLSSQAATIPDSVFGPKSASVLAKEVTQSTVNPRDVVQRLDDLKTKFANQVAPEADLAAIDQVRDEFLRNNPDAMPANEAQALKVGTYRQLKSKAYDGLSSATVEAQKQLARGLKEELETQFPGIRDLNASESRAINLDGALERAVRRIGNRDLYSLGGKVMTGAGGAIFGASHGTMGAASGALAATVIHHVITDPVIKSKLAIALQKSSRGNVSPTAAAASVQLYTNTLAAAANRNSEATQ